MTDQGEQPAEQPTPPPYSSPSAPPPYSTPATPPPYSSPATPPPYAPPVSPYTPGAPVAKSPVLSIIGMVAGILGVLLSITFILAVLGFILGAAGVVLGFLGRAKERASKGLWLTAIITGFVAVAVALLWLIVIIGVFALHSTNSDFSN